jgi:hypothetical protein
MSGQHLKLEGIGAFDAAVHCASVAAADRQHKIKRSQSATELPAGAAAGAAPAMGRSPSGSALAPPAGAARRQPAGAAHAAPPRHRSRSFSARSNISSASLAESLLPVSTPFASRALQSAAAAPAAPLTPPQLPNGFRSAFAGAAAQSPPRSPAAAPPSPPSASASLAARRPSPRTPEPARAGSPVDAATATATASPYLAAASRALAQASRVGAAAAALKDGGRFSSRSIQLTDVPESDETVAVGQTDTLGGKFKVTLKAFSRKVARSLSFTQRSPSAAAVAAAGGGDGGAGPSGSRGSTPRGEPRVQRAASGGSSSGGGYTLSAAAAAARTAPPPPA